MKFLAKIAIFLILGLFLFITILLAKKAVPFHLASVLHENHSVRKTYDHFVKTYEDEGSVYLLVQKSTALTETEAFELASFIRKHYMALPYITSVKGLDRAEYLTFKNFYFQFTPFYSDRKLSSTGRETLEDPFWQSVFLSKDHTSLLTRIELSPEVKDKTEQQIMTKIMAISVSIEQAYPGVSTHLLGTKVAKYHFLVEMVKNLKTIMPLLVLALCLLIFLLFRSYIAVAWFLVILGITYMFTIVLILMVEGGMSPFNVFALFFVLVVSTSDYIHLLVTYYKTEEQDLAARLKSAIKKIYFPCLLTSITTAIGFSSLIFNEIKPLQYFGLYAAIGSIVCFLVTFHFLPFVIKEFESGFGTLKIAVDFHYFINWMNWVLKRPKTVVTIFFFVFVLFAYGAISLQVDDNFYNKFPDSHPLTKAVEAFNQKFNYVGTIDLLYRPLKNKITDLEFEQVVFNFESKLADLEQVSRVESFSSISAYLRRVITGKYSPEFGASYDSNPELMSAYHFVRGYRLLEKFIHPSETEIRASLSLKSLSTKDVIRVMSQIDELKKSYSSIFDVNLSGFAVLRTYIYNSIIQNFLKSFGLCLLLIFTVFLCFLKSPTLALIAMLPNIFPLAFAAGLMGYLQIPVEVNLVLMLCVTIGIAVDDTIHFLYSIKKYNGDFEKAFNSTSYALIGTTFVFVLSFPILLLGELKIYSQMGVFVLASLLVALVADYLLLPSLLKILMPQWTTPTLPDSRNDLQNQLSHGLPE